MREILLDSNLRDGFIERGLQQLGRFSWERTAAQVLEAYEEIGAHKKRTD